MFVFEILSKVYYENVEEEWGCLHSLGNSFGYGYFLFTVNSDAEVFVEIHQQLLFQFAKHFFISEGLVKLIPVDSVIGAFKVDE